MSRRWIAGVRNVFRRAEVDHELDAEINAHVQLLVDENEAQGLTPQAAQRQALIEVGGVEQVKDEVRETRPGLWMEQLWQDLRYGLRMLRHSPAFTTMAAITLALAIGANTAMFSVIHGVLLQPPPFADPSKVAFVWQKQGNGSTNIFSTPDYLEWKRQNSPVSPMTALVSQSHILGTKDQVERVTGWSATWEVFSVFGVSPAIGRSFTTAEDVSGGAKVLILSDALWRTRFQSDPKILGAKVDLDGVPYAVIGVMPQGFYIFDNSEQFWTPLQLQTQDTAASSRTVHWLMALTRLGPDASLKQSQAAVDGVAARLRHDDPQSDAGLGVTLQGFQDANLQEVRGPLWLLMGCVGFVLLIACANVANLLLARGTARRLEISIRTAVGAHRGRVIRQLLTESVLLSLLGGVLGLGLAWIALRGLLALHPSSLPSVATIHINLAVLGFTLAVCMVVGVVFGLAPAWASSRVDVSNALRDAGRNAGRGGGKNRAFLVIAETALASVLLVGAGLALKSLWKVNQVDPGFNPGGLMTFRVDAPARVQDQPFLFFQDVAERVRALPGVRAAALVRNLPMTGTDPSMPVAVDGAAPQVTKGEVVTRFRVIGPDYFRTLQTPLLQGREFTADDTASSQPVVIISQSLQQRYWPNQNPLGKTLKPNIADARWYTVVGIVGDVRHVALDVDASPAAYYPYAQVPKSLLPLAEKYGAVAIRSDNPAGLLDSVRRAVAGVDATVPVYAVQTMDEVLAQSSSLRRFDTWLIAAFAALALTLAAIGIYGVMAYSVSQRTREIGIRMAMGAQHRHVLRLILGQGFKMALAGVAAGLTAALALARLMASLVYETSTTDVWTFLAVATSALVFILLACCIPSLRAMRVDPNMALRHE